jgi:hypothetical protein
MFYELGMILQVGYPDDLAYKLYDRRAKILVLFRLENYLK